MVRCRTYRVAVVGFMNVVENCCRTLTFELAGGATAAAGLSSRRGFGRVMHLDVRTFGFRVASPEGQLAHTRKPGAANQADLGTQHLDRKTLQKHVAALGFYVVACTCSRRWTHRCEKTVKA